MRAFKKTVFSSVGQVHPVQPVPRAGLLSSTITPQHPVPLPRPGNHNAGAAAEDKHATNIANVKEKFLTHPSSETCDFQALLSSHILHMLSRKQPLKRKSSAASATLLHPTCHVRYPLEAYLCHQ